MKKILCVFAVLVVMGLGFRAIAEEDCEKNTTKQNKEALKHAKTVLKNKIKAKKDCKEEVYALKKDINSLNLINGLHLTGPQIEKLLSYARELEKISHQLGMKKKKVKMSDRDGQQVVNLLKQFKASLLKGQKIPRSLNKQLQRIYRKYRPQNSRENRREYLEQLEILENKARQVLVPAQLDVLSTYKSCLIPPKNLKNPVRIGQASTNDSAIRSLNNLRTIPDWKYDFVENVLVDQFLENYEHNHGKYTPKEKKQLTKQILSVIRKARSMNKIQFELHKNKLAKEFKPFKKSEQLKRELKEIIHSQGKYIPGKVAKFLLKPIIIPVYEKRLALLKNHTVKQSDLSKIKNANKNRGCSLPKK